MSVIQNGHRVVWMIVVLLGATVNAQLPAPKPGPAHAMFQLDAGTWDCQVKMYFQGPTGPPSEFKGVEENKLLAGGLYLQSKFECNMGGRTFKGHGLSGYDPRAKKYRGTWVDNFTSSPTQFVASFDEKTKTYTMLSKVYDASTKTELPQKQVTVYTGKNTKQFDIYMVVPVGDKSMEVKLMSMKATRRAKK